MAARSSMPRSRSIVMASGAGALVARLRRLGGGQLAHAALERAHRLAARGDGEPAGDRTGVVEAVEVQERAAPGDLDDVVGVRVAEAVAAGDRVQHGVQERDEGAPGVLAAGCGLPGEVGEGERGHVRRAAGCGRGPSGPGGPGRSRSWVRVRARRRGSCAAVASPCPRRRAASCWRASRAATGRAACGACRPPVGTAWSCRDPSGARARAHRAHSLSALPIFAARVSGPPAGGS